MFSGYDVSFERGGNLLVHPFSFALNPGEWIAVSGPNGSGKSSLLRLLAGLLPYTTGTFHWETIPFSPCELIHRKRVAYLALPPQEMSLPTSLRKHTSLLKEWDLEACHTYPLDFLSQGQKQRLGLLELFLSQRPLWLLDEPTQHLDERGKNLFCKSFKRHLEKGGMAFIATHEPLNLSPHQQLVF